MVNLYTTGIACPILWVLAFLELARSIGFKRDYNMLKLESSRKSSRRCFLLFLVLLVLAIVVTVLMIDTMRNISVE
jgi:hypothetical protein